jgi:hypothetical protein
MEVASRSKPNLVQRWRAFDASPGLNWQWQLAVFIAAMLLIFSRRPDVIFNAQFYAEDGSVWFADAYNHGWLRALTMPDSGYFQTLPRLFAGVSLLVPLLYAPLVMNLFGIALQALPAWFLLTRRCTGWGSLPVRILQVILYLVIPNAREVHVVLTNAQFHFAVFMFLVALAAPPPDRRWKIFDVTILLIGGLSGPFGLFLLPLVLIFWRIRRRKWSLAVAAILLPTCLVQLVELLFGGLSNRAPGQMGASFSLFCHLVGGHIYAATIIGANTFAMDGDNRLAILITVGVSALIIYCLLKARLELRLFIVFAFVILATSLLRPMVADAHQWQIMTTIKGMRYWFFPMLAFEWCILWCAANPRPFLQLIGICTLMTMSLGVLQDWVYPPYTDEHFQDSVNRFNAAPPGTIVDIPLYPDGIVAHLRKK